MKRLLVTASIAVALLGCGDTEPKASQPFASTREVVATTFYPTTWMCESIFDGIVPIECAVPESRDPSSWQPDSQAIQSLQSAKLVVVNGAGYEKWLVSATLPTSRIVDTSADFAEPFIQYENVVTHQHGPVGSQSLEGVDGHIWLDPIRAKHQASQIAAVATRTFPTHANAIAENLRSVHEQLDALDVRTKSLASRLKTSVILCQEQKYNYLARRYDLPITNLEANADNPLSKDRLAAFAKDDSEHAKIFLLTVPPDPKVTEALTSAGFKAVVFETGEQPPAIGDYISLMNENLDRLENALK